MRRPNLDISNGVPYMAEQDSSTRTIAGVAAVIGITSLLLGIGLSVRTGLIAEFAGTTKNVSQQNETALQDQIAGLNKRMDALEAKMKKAKPAPPPAAAPAPE